MLIPALIRENSDAIYILGLNTAGEQVSGGAFVCYDYRATNSLGIAVFKPTTSGVTLFAGIVAGQINAGGANTDIAISSYGLIQAWGLNVSVKHNMGLASVSAAGHWLIPWNASYSGQSYRISAGFAASWTSEAITIARGCFVMDNTVSGSGWCRAFVRAL